ncbi:sugar transferase [Bacteroides sp.]
MYRHFFKRLISIILALCGLTVCAIPMIIVAIIIKYDSKGPALFKQVRMGKHMKPFTCYKFRTMCQGAFEKGGIVSSESDSRITKVGAVLRRTSLDELPQIFNILNGTMAIIGPRPILDFEFEPYKSNTYFYKRYEVLPGMFCTVDLDLRATADRETQFEMDAQYVDDMSLVLDVKAFFGIISMVVLGKNVYKDSK